ncbi:hypothetical protein BU16DRAFT_532952 [Lophium mytilinum]|uniref:Uncharacterized protein n=1 Tax=Lophium mytilinum TaxID=390894 RepID=A0A6A6RD50_9PEZI|nr:hypothetical protein BU16DRAFT_532952 [Lophium mytilinum]
MWQRAVSNVAAEGGGRCVRAGGAQETIECLARRRWVQRRGDWGLGTGNWGLRIRELGTLRSGQEKKKRVESGVLWDSLRIPGGVHDKISALCRRNGSWGRNSRAALVSLPATGLRPPMHPTQHARLHRLGGTCTARPAADIDGIPGLSSAAEALVRPSEPSAVTPRYNSCVGARECITVLNPSPYVESRVLAWQRAGDIAGISDNPATCISIQNVSLAAPDVAFSCTTCLETNYSNLLWASKGLSVVRPNRASFVAACRVGHAIQCAIVVRMYDSTGDGAILVKQGLGRLHLSHRRTAPDLHLSFASRGISMGSAPRSPPQPILRPRATLFSLPVRRQFISPPTTPNLPADLDSPATRGY